MPDDLAAQIAAVRWLVEYADQFAVPTPDAIAAIAGSVTALRTLEALAEDPTPEMLAAARDWSAARLCAGAGGAGSSGIGSVIARLGTAGRWGSRPIRSKGVA